MKNPFNPQQWLSAVDNAGGPQGAENAPGKENAAQGSSRTRTDAENRQAVERALEALEASGTDLTSSYKSWIEIGFAFVEAFAESGRSYFHRVSQFHPEYNYQDCDKQYDHCLRSKGWGITLGTFFHYLKHASLEMFQHAVPRVMPPALPGSEESYWDSHSAPRDFSEALPPEAFSSRDSEEVLKPDEVDHLPCFPDEIFEKLPNFLQKTIGPAKENMERDVLLLGSMVVLGACLSKVYGYYHGARSGANLYCFVTAPASAGKGRINLCRRLALPIHKLKRSESKSAKQEYELKLAEFNQQKSGEKPLSPGEKMLFIPANNSSTGIFQLLADNGGKGLIFETEADTMAQIFKKEYGDYSDGFRKAWHRETISYYRRTDKEYVDLEDPCLSAVLTGTPRQVSALIPSTENGLFSRFLFYYMNLEPTWIDVWAEDGDFNAQDHFDNLGAQFFEFHRRLEKVEELRVQLSPAQKLRFNTYFEETQNHYLAVLPGDYTATIRRMGMVFFRITMILSVLRLMQEREIPQVVECSDTDFEIALGLVYCLIQHSSFVYKCLPEEKEPVFRSSRNEKFLQALPKEFGRADYLRVAEGLEIRPKTAEKWINRFLTASMISRVRQGVYVKLEKSEKGGSFPQND